MFRNGSAGEEGKDTYKAWHNAKKDGHKKIRWIVSRDFDFRFSSQKSSPPGTSVTSSAVPNLSKFADTDGNGINSYTESG